MNLPKKLAAQPTLLGADVKAIFDAIVAKLNGNITPADLAPGFKIPLAQREKTRATFVLVGRFYASAQGATPFTSTLRLALPPIGSFYWPSDPDIRTVSLNARHQSGSALTGSITATRNGGQSSGALSFSAVAAGKIYASNQAWATTPPASGDDYLDLAVSITAPASVNWGEFMISVLCSAKFVR